MNASTQPAVVVGTMAASGFFNSVMVLGRNPDAARRFLETAAARGFDLFDTAPIYGRGFAEQDLGAWLPSHARVWTKVGVDIEQPLPRLDYSLDGMIRSLSGSLARLGRDSVSVAMVHNPVPPVLENVDLAGFAEHCRRTGAAEMIGVSVLAPEQSLPLLAPRLPPGSVVMCEAEQLRADDRATRSLLSDYRLVIRSILAHGALIRDVPEAGRAAAVESRIDELTAAYAPDAVVIGPRTAAQFADYRPLGAWQQETAHAS
ncbi:aryl-alcohol dehydrogenase-like predicted oxidoreductase [Streptomyces sp. B4I13]|uniref:aldo/keto reductase n=1 Tax=Streptomyces sp. B4I13 TaxID=3042271 RepID=UPI002786FDF1|nr:aldo/keto reductase [Streptomyces sp. B4I13]MDQ0958577.1 aryl-alcohol dehydrogenase-like predicted oxidoreductase [Streptomyces sp. B4I13]